MKNLFFKILAIVTVLFLIIMLCSCDFSGYDFVDTKYHFDRAIIKMPDGTVKDVEIKKWADSEGEQLTITAKDGTVYLVSSVNCILVEEP